MPATVTRFHGTNKYSHKIVASKSKQEFPELTQVSMLGFSVQKRYEKLKTTNHLCPKMLLVELLHLISPQTFRHLIRVLRSCKTHSWPHHHINHYWWNWNWIKCYRLGDNILQQNGRDIIPANIPKHLPRSPYNTVAKDHTKQGNGLLSKLRSSHPTYSLFRNNRSWTLSETKIF